MNDTTNRTDPRSGAATAIAAVLSGRSLDDALVQADTGLSPSDRSLLRALSYGVLREHSQLEALASMMLNKRQPAHVPQLNALIEAGLYQLRSMRISPHAAVNQTVAACDTLGTPGHRGLVNALLRRYLREREALESSLPGDPAMRWSYPGWLVDQVQRDWPERWEGVLEAGNRQAPLSLRVNRRLGTRANYLAKLRTAGLAAEEVAEAPDALVLEHPVPVDRLPGFDRGECSVQDVSAQLAVDLLQLEPSQRVLDACAAPGGKTAHMLERCELQHLLAVDSDPTRLQRIDQTLARLGLKAQTLAFDAGRLQDRWSGPPFDRILLDAPCSGTGVIRRHPDIKWLRRPDDIGRLADEQLRLLFALWPLLAPGGRLVYATCSILCAEGENVIRQFLLRQPDAKHEPIHANWGEPRRLGRRIAPGGNWDGFYYAVLKRAEAKSSIDRTSA
jgi:16S rRNA (cytosine967-C5)-methyltransferase